MNLRILRTSATVLGGMLVAGGCADGGPAAPQVGPQFEIVGQSDTRNVAVCKLGPEGSTATFEVELSGTGTLVSGSSFTLPALPDECIPGVNQTVAWEIGDLSDPPATITVTETASTAGVELYLIATAGGLDGAQYIYPPENSITVRADETTGGFAIWFKNEGTPITGAGCTPGYWKQEQHFDSWPAPYTPGTLFSDVFGVGFPGMSLLEVASQGGGGLNALGRHTVAALLSAASGGVDYPASVDDVISAFNAAFSSGDYETQKNIFAEYNELGCPLN